jgi:ssDNA-binding replication factor A large subunit
VPDAAVERDPKAAAIVREIIRRKPDLREDDVWGMIHRKMEEMGSSYLTEVGAGYLVASDLGIDLSSMPRQPLRIAELKPGLRRVDVTALFLCKGRELSFESRTGTGTGRAYEYRVFDAGTVVRLMVWGDPDFRKIMDTLKPGDAITITGAYTRLGRTGEIEIHVDEKGSLDLPHEQAPGSVLETITIDASEVGEDALGRGLIVRGRISSDVQEREYTRDSATRSLVFFTISGEKNPDARLRVVIWGKSADSIPGIGPGAIVRLVCFRARRGRDGSLELHGDAGSTVEVISGTPARARSDEIFLVSSDMVPGELPTAEAALLSGDDLIRVVATGPAAEALYGVQPGSIVRLRSRRLASEEDLEVLGKRPDLLESLTVAAKDLEPYGRRICVFDGVVLSRAIEREVTSRSGENLRRASLMLGDHTGEVEVVAWRSAADKLMPLDVGERVKIYGALVVKREGRPPSLEVRGFSRIERNATGGSQR